jgi:RNA polymerase sigma-B factor
LNRPPRRLHVSINGATSRLSHQLGRAPPPSEIAAHLDPAGGGRARRPATPYRASSLDEVLDADGGGHSDTTLGERFYANMAQTQIADRVGLSQMHVSRLLAKTLAQLRDQLLNDHQ